MRKVLILISLLIGPTYLTAQNHVVSSNVNNILFADRFTGGDCAQKINAADAQLGSLQGEIWVNQACGMVWVNPVSLSAGHTLRFVQGGTYSLSAPITLAGNTTLSGSTGAMAVNTTPSVMLQMTARTNLGSLVTVNGSFVSIQDIELDGNKTNNSTGGSGIVATSAATRLNVDRVTIGNFATNGVTINGGASDKFFKLMTYQNSGDGLSCIGTANSGGDAYVTDSEIENNNTNGIELNSCPAWRINHSDFGQNSFTVSGACGLNIYATGALNSNLEIITSNQFGNNFRNDLCINGFSGGLISSSGSIIENNSFIGGSRLSGGVYDDIVLVDGGANVITGNTFSASSVNPDAYAISVTAPNNSLGNLIRDNVFIDINTNSGSPAFNLGRIQDATANGVSCETASLVLGAGWGTGATVTLPNGILPNCVYTITSGSASYGAAPTVTYNFPGSLVQAFGTTTNGPICLLHVVAQTGSGGAIVFNPTSATITAETWTAQVAADGSAFTPAITETYKVVTSCSP